MASFMLGLTKILQFIKHLNSFIFICFYDIIMLVFFIKKGFIEMWLRTKQKGNSNLILIVFCFAAIYCFLRLFRPELYDSANDFQYEKVEKNCDHEVSNP